MNSSNSKKIITLSEEHSLSYYEYGDGPRVLLAFHGFGLDGSIFEGYSKLFPQYTLYSFNLYYHDLDSRYPIPSRYSPEEFLRIMNEFFIQKEINSFDLLLFSIGSRFGLTLLTRFPERVEHATLIAPDGLVSKTIYQFATRTLIGKFLFQTACRFPALLELPIQALTKLKILPKSIEKLVQSELANRFLRKRLYNTWTLASSLMLNDHELIQLSKHFPHLKIQAFLARKEVVLPNRQIIKMLPETCDIQWVNCNHFQLPRKVCEIFKNKLCGEGL
ncbi:MAG: alpha/beta hydrolase [Cytophagales bacterium]|nr:alpha/beta hydrolase [Cytophagales bacterium]